MFEPSTEALGDDCLELANIALYQSPAALASIAAIDPLEINLPPLGPNGAEFSIDPAALRTLATLYFQAELEQVGFIPVAELLSDERQGLVAGRQQASARLENFFQRRRGWYDRPARNRLFARLFGTGPAVNDEAGNAINRDFMRRLGGLCLAINHVEEDYRFGQTSTYTDTALRYAAMELLNNLGPRQYGNALLAAQQIQDQLREAIALLSDPAIQDLFGGHGLWDTLQKILGSQMPEYPRLVELAQNGIRLLNWLASAIPQIKDPAPTRPLLPPESPVFTWASAWLAAIGREDHQGIQAQRSAAQQRVI